MQLPLDLLRPYESEEMEVYEANPKVGNIRNNGPDVNISYLADNALIMRYFEAGASVRRAVSVLKKRSGTHENTIRELRFGSDGIQLGEPLAEFKGVLSGTPDSVAIPETSTKEL